MTLLMFASGAVRSLRRSPRYCVAVVSIVALSIGGVAGVFALIYGILLRPLPYREPDRLVLLFEHSPQFAHMTDAPFFPVNVMHFIEWRQRATSFSEMALFAWHEESLSGTGGGVPARVGVAWVWPSFLKTLGVSPSLGRDFVESESEPGKGGSVLISDRFWRERFGSEPGAIGRTIVLDDRVFGIAGVLPEEFKFPDTSRALPMFYNSQAIDILRPFELRNRDPEGNFNWWVIGRLANGVDARRAKSELDTLCAGIADTFANRVDLFSVVRPLHASMVGDSRKPLLLALAAVGLVLLIGCLNLACLALYRVRNRSSEIATHAAVGADPGSLVGQFLSEGVLLGIAGGCAGIAVAAGLAQGLRNWYAVDLPLIESVSLDLPVILFALAASGLSVALFSAAPARYVSSLPPNTVLLDSGRASTESRGSRRASNLFVAGQVALSVTLLVLAGLLLQSLRNALDQDPGFDMSGAAIAEVSVSRQQYNEPVLRANAHNEMLREIEAIPSVLAAGLVSLPPLGGTNNVSDITAVGEAELPLQERPFASFRWASSNYFAAMGIPILKGSVYSDSETTPAPAVISEGVAEALWPGREPIGRELIGRAGEHLTVVAVVPDASVESLETETSLMVYTPHWYDYVPLDLWLVIRAQVDPLSLAGPVRTAIWSVDPEVPIGALEPARSLVDRSLATRLFASTTVGLFSLLAFLLAALGVYSVAAESMSRRIREVGIRCALGAPVERVRRDLVLEAMYPVFIGLAVGIACAYGLAPLLQGMFFGVEPLDPSIHLAAGGVVVLGALLACYAPVRRASEVRMTDALRNT
ncbi:MAG: ADOP family duplicated permease [Bryobacterales bacterium]|nr:ADOP family duplicated permease [Bryobacterales bacterium]